MLKDLEFSHMEIISATKNITDLYVKKDVNITITMVREEDSFTHLEGIEQLVHKTRLHEENKFIKLSCIYGINKDGQIILPIKVAYNGSTEKYSKRASYEHNLTPEFFEDINFIENFFDRSPNDLKRVFI